MKYDIPLLAFVHIEKSAGRSLTSLLHQNYLLQYADVRPLSPSSERKFGSKDLVTYNKINPFISCIAGHSVMPYSGLEEVEPEIEYITLLREPITRCISHYTYGFGGTGEIPFSFEEYLEMDFSKNFQTQKYVISKMRMLHLKFLMKNFLL